MKHAWSQSRRWEPRPPLPFPLQDSEGRLASVSQLYEHAAAQPAAHHNVAGQAIMHLHLDMLPQKDMCLRNQVACMIAEYHITASGLRSVKPPPNNSTGGGTFAAFPKELHTGCSIRRHQRCEGHGPCHGPPVSCLATLARYGCGRGGDGLRDFGGLVVPPRPTPGVISDM